MRRDEREKERGSMKVGESCKEDSLFSLSEIQFNQIHLCAGRQLFLGGDLSRVLVRGLCLKCRGNYHFLPITVPGM